MQIYKCNEDAGMTFIVDSGPCIKLKHCLERSDNDSLFLGFFEKLIAI